MLSRHFSHLAVAMCALYACLTGLCAETPHTATVASFATPPAIDGNIQPGEWDGAVRTVGFQNIVGGGFTDARTGATYFGFHGDMLYLAMASELPPDGKLRTNQKNRDSMVIWDEGVEIWLDPNRDRRVSGEGDQSYYQFMGNSIGTILDVQVDPKKGAPDTGWNADWTYRNSVDTEAGVWMAELSVPITDLGWKPGSAIGRSIGVLMARNYKAGGWLQGTWFPHQGAFVSWFEYPRIYLTKDAPSVAIESLGEKVFTGTLELKTRIHNPGPARQANVNLLITSTDMPELKDEKVLDLPANGSMDYIYTVNEGRLHEDARHTLSFTVQSPDGKTSYLNYAMKWTKAPENKWPGVFVGPNPAAAVQLAYYPSYTFFRLKLDVRELGKEMEGCASAKVTLTAPGGKELLSKTATWAKSPAVVEYRVPGLPDGKYAVTVQFDGYKDAITRVFTRKHFPWEGNTLGITEKIYPPFEPITVRNDDVNVVLRSYSVDGLGLWNSVKAAGNVSAGPAIEMLAGPMALKINGDQTITGKGKFTKKKDHVVVYEGKASAPGVQVKTRCTTEYDGCMKVEMDLLPSRDKQEVQSLWLDIPIKDELAPLYHVSTTSLRYNPAGATPAGEGEVWDSRKFPDGDWYGNFKCYLWLGGEERGLCWFADNDAGWELAVDQNPDKSAPCQQLIRKDGVLTLRVNFIQKPVTITEPRKIVFGLMASPAKPMMKDWRRVTYGRTRHQGHPYIAWMGSEYWGADDSFSSKYPRNGDFSILDAIRDNRLGKTIDRKAVIQAFDERNFKPGIPMGAKSREQILNLLEVTLNHTRGVGPGNYFNAYWDEFHSTCPAHEEVQTFKNEWSGTYGYGSIGGLVQSHQDFAVWYGAEFVKRGIGLYFDNAFPKRAHDSLTTSAYRLPNGDIQPSAGMWAHREYLKRIWVIHQELGPKDIMPMMMIHMTNTHIVPYMVWNESNLDLEWFYGPEPAQAKYPHELLRAESLGRQTGNIPLVLARSEGATKTKEERLIADRTRVAAMMVHEIKPDPNGGRIDLLEPILEFAYGEDDCRVYNYWDAGYPVKTSNDAQVKSLLLKHHTHLLLLLCSWNPKPEKITVQVDGRAVGLNLTKALDEETGEDIPLNKDKRMSISLDGYGVKLIRIK